MITNIPSKVLISFFTLLTLLTISQLFANNSQVLDSSVVLRYESNEYWFKLKELKQSLLFKEVPRTVPYNEKAQELYANMIINDSLLILNSFDPFFKPIEEINWKENPYNNDTWQLYYENLLFVSTLNHAYYNTKKKEYHIKAKQYIKNYISSHETDSVSTSKFSWYDHSCAFRVLHILQTISNELSTNQPDIKFIQTAFDHISLNMKFMINPKNYRSHNHSLMMDRSLLYLANILDDKPDLSNHIRSLASNRALGNFDKIIDNSGMAKEHSTTYHIFNHNLYKNIFKLIGNNETATDKLLKYLKMNDVLLQLVKPNLTFPLWGDSQIEILNPKLIADFDDDARLTAVYENYDLKSNVNFENNIAVLRTKTNDKSYLALFANYNSMVHKHHDDLSIVFQAFGTDIFTDQGYFGYDKEYRPQLISVFAHNSVAINNEDYIIGKINQYSKINSYTTNKDYEMVEASHNMYDSLTVRRSVYFVKPNLIILKDHANGSKKVNSLHQIFNLGKGADEIEIMENKINFSMPKNLNVSFSTTDRNNNFKKKGFYRSVRPYNIKDSYQIILESNQPNVTTLILIDSDDYESKITSPMVKDDILYFYKENKKYHIDLH